MLLGNYPFPRMPAIENIVGLRGCRVRATAVTSVPNATGTDIVFGQVMWASDPDMWRASDPTRIWIPPSWPTMRRQPDSNRRQVALMRVGFQISATALAGEQTVRAQLLQEDGGNYDTMRLTDSGHTCSMNFMREISTSNQAMRLRITQQSGGAVDFATVWTGISDWWGPTEMWAYLIP